MTEAEWLACTDPAPMLEFLRGRASDRRLRLFAVACCRRIQYLLMDQRSLRAVEIAESYADGAVDEAERAQAERLASDALLDLQLPQWDPANAAADAAHCAVMADAPTTEELHGPPADEASCCAARAIAHSRVPVMAEGARTCKIDFRRLSDWSLRSKCDCCTTSSATRSYVPRSTPDGSIRLLSPRPKPSTPTAPLTGCLFSRTPLKTPAATRLTC